MEKNKVITPALNKSITKEDLRLLKEKRLSEVTIRTKDKIESENSKVITPEYLKLLRERRLKETIKKEKDRKDKAIEDLLKPFKH